VSTASTYVVPLLGVDGSVYVHVPPQPYTLPLFASSSVDVAAPANGACAVRYPSMAALPVTARSADTVAPPDVTLRPELAVTVPATATCNTVRTTHIDGRAPH
jgi:hypothetical protein